MNDKLSQNFCCLMKVKEQVFASNANLLKAMLSDGKGGMPAKVREAAESFIAELTTGGMTGKPTSFGQAQEQGVMSEPSTSDESNGGNAGGTGGGAGA